MSTQERTAAPEANEPEVVELPAAATAVIAGVVPMDEIPGFFDRAFAELAATLADQQLSPAGPAFALYHRPPAGTADLEVGFPVDRPVRAEGRVGPGTLPAGRTARLEHRGTYDTLRESWNRLQGWMAERGLVAGELLWECYVTEPRPDLDPATMVTVLHWPLAG